MAAVVEQAIAFEASCERGGMIAYLRSVAVRRAAFLNHRSELAGINFKSHFAVSAVGMELDAIESVLKQRRVAHQRLAVSFAFHSRWIDNARDRVLSFMRSVRRRKSALPLACCAQATPLHDVPDDFFWRVVRQPIRFRDTVAHLERQGPHRYIDLGPSGTLATFVKYGLAPESRSTTHAVLTPFGQDEKNLASLLASH